MRAVLLLATATALILNGSASAQVVQDRWTFAVLTIWQSAGRAHIKREPYGVFTSSDDCNKARAAEIAELDVGNSRLPHLTPNAPTIITTVGNRTTESKGGPIERMDVTDCEVLR